jgi:penicillin-binding protein 1A
MADDDHDRQRLRPTDVLGRVGLLVLVVAASALLLAATIAPAVFTADAAVDSVERELFDHPPLPDELPVAAQISHVLDREGEPITALHGPIEREPVALGDISQKAIDAVIATEDAEFYEHDGVNHDSIVRAGLRNVQAGGVEEGASTITQQLVTMAYLDPEPTIERKLREIVWAVQFEERYDKDEILEQYLNRIYLGHGVYGIGTAADYYFSTPASELDLAQSALLAGAIRAPTTNNPVDNPEAAATRRDIVIRQMQALDMVDDEDAEAVVGTDVELDVREDEEGEPFWEDLVKRVIYDPNVDLQPGLQEAVGDTVEARVDALFEGGLEITTTLDRQMHGRAIQTVADHLDDPVDDPLASLITVDHRDGAVRALALGPKEFGPCDEEDEPCTTTQVNPAVPGIGGSGRQSGSAFKPFVSAAALEAGDDFEIAETDADNGDDENGNGNGNDNDNDNGVGLDIEYDTPSGEEIEDCGWGEEWEPENFDLEDHGEIQMPEAMRDSTNIYFAKLARDVGVDAVVETARAHGITHSPNLGDFGEQDCSIGLGSAEVFPWEMTAGYGAWANDGEHCEPYLIERVVDRDGEVLYEHEPDCERATDEETAATMRELLEEPVSSDGTAATVGASVPGAIGKTGTTDNFRDAWFVGSAGVHTTAAWMGFERPDAHPGGMRDLTIGGQHYDRIAGGTLPAPMWAEYMSGIDGD